MDVPYECSRDGGTQKLERGHPLDGLGVDHHIIDGGLVVAKVHHHLLRFCGVELEVVGLSPLHQSGNLLPVCRLVCVRDKANQGGVIGKLDQLWGGVARGAVIGKDGEQERR